MMLGAGIGFAHGLVVSLGLVWIVAEQHPLEEFNEALFFHQFAERATRHGLAFLAEAEFRMMQIDGLPAPVAHTLNRMAAGILQREQLTDFLRTAVEDNRKNRKSWVNQCMNAARVAMEALAA
jgi:hypothetical protein